MDPSRWCNGCRKRQPVGRDDTGYVLCTACGLVLDTDVLSTEPVFIKDSFGQSQIDGKRVQSVQSNISDSFERRLRSAYDFIYQMADNLGVGVGDHIAFPAKGFYRIAMEHNFVQGRRGEHVAAACLYIACRVQKRPFLLIEFAHLLAADVYVLGAVFLQLVRVLHLGEHPTVLKPVDPSLFVHRFVYGLIGEANKEVERTALRIVTSMKHNWIQTGRKPSGICGAAVYLSALAHGYSFSKAQVVNQVHICEATLNKRLIEFEETESGGLTFEEFHQKSEELQQNFDVIKKKAACKEGELLCEHKGSNVPHFAHGLCAQCYDEFVTMSGGLDGGSDPPAFKRAEKKRLALACSKGSSDNLSGITDDVNEKLEYNNDVSDSADYMGAEVDESGCLSDVDDAEIENCINTEQERKNKEVIWEQINPDYIVKEAVVKKPKKERKRKAEGEAETAAEAAQKVLVKKRISSRINFDNLKELFADPEVTKTPKSTFESLSNRSEVIYDSENAADADEYEECETMGQYNENELTYSSEDAAEADEHEEPETIGGYGESDFENYHDHSYYYSDQEGGDFDDE